MQKRATLSCLPRLFPLLLIALGAASCSIPSARVYGRAAQLDFGGDISFDPTGPGNATTDVDALGLDDETVFAPRVDLDWDPIHLSVDAFQADFEGDGTADFNLGGITPGTPIQSEVSTNLYTAKLWWDIVPSLLFDLGIGIGAGYLQTDVFIDSGGAALGSDSDVPFAFLTARVGREFGKFEVLGTLSGASLEFSDDDSISYLDFDAFVGWKFVDNVVDLELIAGYRYVDLDFEYDDDGDVTFENTIDGPYLGLVLSF